MGLPGVRDAALVSVGVGLSSGVTAVPEGVTVAEGVGVCGVMDGVPVGVGSGVHVADCVGDAVAAELVPV